MTLERTHQIIWNSFYSFFVLLFILWFFTALESYLSKSASSSVSFNQGDSGDMMVVFPILTICKAVDPKVSFWRGIKQTCKGRNLMDIQPPYFLNYLKECLEHDDATQVEDLINHLSYDLDEVIEDVKFVNPEFPDGEAQYVPLMGGEGPHWKSKLQEVLSSLLLGG